MHTRYFRLKDPKCRPEEIEWIEMSGKEFYCFINSPEGRRRHFIDMDDVVLEASEGETRQYKSEKNHSYYIQAQEDGWSTLSIYAIENENGCSGEEIAVDETRGVEDETIMRMEIAALQKAVSQLDSESYQLIHSLYLADTRKTLRRLSQDSGVPVMTLQDRKKKILAGLAQALAKKNF